MRRTGAAAQTAAAQVGKRCQLSNGTRHSCIIAHTYDNARNNAYALVGHLTQCTLRASPALTTAESGSAKNITARLRSRTE